MFTPFSKKILIFSLFFFAFFFKLSFAQKDDSLICVHFQNAPLTDVLKYLSEQKPVNFVYNQSIVRNKRVSCSFVNKPFIEVLNKVLRDAKLKIGYYEGSLITLVECKKFRFDLEGRLVDSENKEPLPFAVVKVSGENLSASTDKTGRFSFIDLEGDDITLEISCLGYKKKSVKILCDKKNYITVEIEKSPFIIGDVEVVDSKNQFIEISNTPGLFAVSSKSYENLPVFSSPDLIRSLQLLPGITSNNGGTAELFIRGGVPSENLITLDGLQLYHLDHFFGFYSSLSATSIKDIRIYKGGFPAKYGSKISGVVDMSSKNGSLTRPKLEIGVNSLNLNLSTEIPISKRMSFIFSGRKILFPDHLNSFYKSLIINKVAGDDYIGSVKYNQDPEIFFGDLFAKTTYMISDKDVLTASFLFTEDDNRILFDNVRTFYDEEKKIIVARVFTNSDENSFWGNKGVSLNWFRSWNSRLKTNLTVSSSFYRSNYNYLENSDESGERTFQFNRQNNLTHGKVNFELSYYSSDYLNYDIGLSLDRNKIEYNSYEFNEEETFNKVEENPFYLAGFFQNRMKFLEKLNVKTGLRFTYNQLTDKVYFEPRLQTSYALSNKVVLKSSFGSYYQFVVKNIDGNSHIAGNVSWVAADDSSSFVSAGRHFTFGAKFETADMIFDVDYFYNTKENIFAFPSFRNVYNGDQRMKNDSEGYTTGFEIQLIKKLGNVTGWVSYTYNKSKYTALIEGIQRKFVPSNNVLESLKLVLQFNFPSWHLSLVCHYASGKPYTIPVLKKADGDDRARPAFPNEINDHRLENNLRFDISFVKKFDFNFVHAELGFSVYNVLDQKNITSRYYYPYYYRYVGEDEIHSRLVKSDRIDFEFTPSLFLNLSF